MKRAMGAASALAIAAVLSPAPAAADAEHALGSLAPAVSLAAALMAAEASRYLLHGGLALAGRMLHADLASFSFEIYDLE